jgi:hypothetical protein
MENRPEADGVGRLTEIIQAHQKKLLVVAGLIALYAIAGFLIAPWLIKKNAEEGVTSALGAELKIAKVAVNPFVLSLRVDGIELDDPSGAPFVKVQQIFVNFQVSSLFRWAWTFKEVRIDAPEVFLSRNNDGLLNAAFLAKQSDAETAQASDDSPAPLLIFDFSINESVINWNDEVPVDAVGTRFGPINIAIAELNTLPSRSGRQDVVITTETSGTLSWNGSLYLNPFLSEGHAAIKGSHFPLTSAYLKHEAGFDVVDGNADVEFDYRLATRDDNAFEARVDNFTLSFSDVVVRTFNQAFGIAEPDREVLRLPGMSLAGASFHWPERTVSAESFSIDDAAVSLYRDVSGRLNVLRPQAEQAEQAETDTALSAADPAGDSDWNVSLDEFSINRMALTLEDVSVDPAAEIGIRSLDLSIRDVSNQPGDEFPTSLTVLAQTEGSVSMNGSIAVLPNPVVDLDLQINDLALAGAHPYLQPLADVNLDSGALDFTGNITSSTEEPVSLTGDLRISDFLITETDEGSRLGSWTALSADNLTLSAASRSLGISEIRLDEPYADILIARDGSVNLGRVKKGKQSGDKGEDGDQDVEDGDEAEEAAASVQDQVNVTVGRVIIENAAADFADLSLPLPFAAKIAELNGELSTIATASTEPSTVALEGKVDEFGLVRVSGFATPADPKINTDLKVAFENVEMPKFSAYTIPFAGREIARGRLDLDLGYKVTASELEGENSIVLRDFELGEPVEHAGAMSLPLDLAVALLKDPDGRITIDLPVRGNVDDPEFGYGGVIMKALGNLIVRIVTSPFSLLANLIGAEASELEYLQFPAGRSDLSPPELEKVAKIAEALALRPELKLQISGVTDQEFDGTALRTAKVDQRIAAEIVALQVAESNEAMYAEQRLGVVEQLFRESGIADPAISFADLRNEHTTSIAGDDVSEATETFDSLAYTESLRRQLVAAEPLVEQELVALATERAENVRMAIVTANPELEARILVTETSAVSAEEGEAVRMPMTLTASGR